MDKKEPTLTAKGARSILILIYDISKGGGKALLEIQMPRPQPRKPEMSLEILHVN